MTDNELRLVREGVNLKWKFWLRPWRLRRDMNDLCSALAIAWGNELAAKTKADELQAELLKVSKANSALTRWIYTTHRLNTPPENGTLKEFFGSPEFRQ